MVSFFDAGGGAAFKTEKKVWAGRGWDDGSRATTTYRVHGSLGRATGDLHRGAAGLLRLHLVRQLLGRARVDVVQPHRVGRRELGLQVPGHLVTLCVSRQSVSQSATTAQGMLHGQHGERAHHLPQADKGIVVEPPGRRGKGPVLDLELPP